MYMMTDSELRRLAQMIVQEQARNQEWMDAFVHAQVRHGEGTPCGRRFLSAHEAAEALGISVWQLYRIKDRFTCIKSGVERSSTLKFDASTLQAEYRDYLQSRSRVMGIVKRVHVM